LYQSQPFFAPAFFDKFSLEKNYVSLLFIHIAFGIILFHFPKLASFFGVAIAVFGLAYIIYNRNKNYEILQVAGYFIGVEVLIRMTHGFLNYEFAKYSVIVLAVLGIFYDGFSKKTWPYWIYLLALIPSVLLHRDIDTISRTIIKSIVFNLSGPICLGIVAVYTYNKKITLAALNKILICIGLPILTCAIYVFIYNPEINIYLRGVCSNPMYSGGFGPNQVASTFGLGMFVFFALFMLNSATKIRFLIHLFLFSLLCYLGLLTFSRGGMITGCLVCIVFLFSIYYNSKSYGKAKSKQGFIYFFAVLLAVVALISYQTKGLIEKRYTNRDHRGKIKVDSATDRKEIAFEEVKMFMKNPVLGIGAGNADQVRESKHGKKVMSHDELTRLLAEHGSLGVINILILIIIPLRLFLKFKENIFIITCFAFWFLTINHSGMRIAAPAFLYALMLLKISIDDVPFFNRETSSEIALK